MQAADIIVVTRNSEVLGSNLGRVECVSSPGVIEVVHIQCAKLFKGLECAVMSMVLCKK